MRSEERGARSAWFTAVIQALTTYRLQSPLTTYLGHERLELRPQCKEEVGSLRHQDDLILQPRVAEAHDLVGELDELGHDSSLVGRARPYISRRREQLHHCVRHAHLVW